MRGSVVQQSDLPIPRLCRHAGLPSPSENVHICRLEHEHRDHKYILANFTSLAEHTPPIERSPCRTDLSPLV